MFALYGFAFSLRFSFCKWLDRCSQCNNFCYFHEGFKPKAAIILAAIFNLLGVFMMGTAVANTTANLVTIGTGRNALITLAAAQLSIVIWAVSAWRFEFTSESHALIAGLMGAGISFKGIEAFNWEEFKRF